VLLTIAIPTYNRNEILFRTIQSIFPQLNSDCGLLIIDNCSDVAVEQTLQPLLEQHQDKQIQIIRNKANIGGNANVIRCIELAESDYVWILGDDDTALPNAVSMIMDKIKLRPDFINFFFPFAHDIIRKHDILGHGIDSLLKNIDSFSNFIFISNMVINRIQSNAGLRYAFHYTGSTGPHVALMLWLASQNGRWELSSQVIVEKGEPDADQRFSVLPVVRGLPSLAWVLDHQYRKQFRNVLRGATVHWLKPHAVVAQLILTESSHSDWISLNNICEYNLIRRFWHKGSNLSLSNLYWLVWSLPLLLPELSFLLIKFISLKRGRPISKANADREF
jgi:glycosyltransferase involved in cell wall biosynthesis